MIKPGWDSPVFQVSIIQRIFEVFIDRMIELDFRALTTRFADIDHCIKGDGFDLNEVRDVGAEIRGSEADGALV